MLVPATLHSVPPTPHRPRSSGYLCRFTDLKITSVLLDDVMAQPDKPERASMVVEHETRSLRDSRTLLAKNGLLDSMQFIEENAHPRLWRLLAETALEKLDLVTAEKAFVACSDYPVRCVLRVCSTPCHGHCHTTTPPLPNTCRASNLSSACACCMTATSSVPRRWCTSGGLTRLRPSTCACPLFGGCTPCY